MMINDGEWWMMEIEKTFWRFFGAKTMFGGLQWDSNGFADGDKWWWMMVDGL